MSVTYSREELSRLVAARRSMVEGQGPGAFVEFRIKVTPELLEAMLGGVWETRDGKRSRLNSIHLTDDGYLEPYLVTEVPA